MSIFLRCWYPTIFSWVFTFDFWNGRDVIFFVTFNITLTIITIKVLNTIIHIICSFSIPTSIIIGSSNSSINKSFIEVLLCSDWLNDWPMRRKHNKINPSLHHHQRWEDRPVIRCNRNNLLH